LLESLDADVVGDGKDGGGDGGGTESE